MRHQEWLIVALCNVIEVVLQFAFDQGCIIKCINIALCSNVVVLQCHVVIPSRQRGAWCLLPFALNSLRPDGGNAVCRPGLLQAGPALQVLCWARLCKCCKK